jgi:hypothetical protein
MIAGVLIGLIWFGLVSVYRVGVPSRDGGIGSCQSGLAVFDFVCVSGGDLKFFHVLDVGGEASRELCPLVFFARAARGVYSDPIKILDRCADFFDCHFRLL